MNLIKTQVFSQQSACCLILRLIKTQTFINITTKLNTHVTLQPHKSPMLIVTHRNKIKQNVFQFKPLVVEAKKKEKNVF